MKIKTSELEGAALDWAVAKCEGETYPNIVIIVEGDGWEEVYSPSTNWSQGGPIIEREKIELIPPNDNDDPDWMTVWINSEDAEAGIQNGPTPLIAAMRCYVASKLENEVDVPDELL